MNIPRIIQLLSFCAFVLLMWYAAFPLVLPVPVNTFLSMDPLAAITAILAAKAFISAVLPGLIILGLSVMLGRFFCSMLCPLGASIDASDYLFKCFSKPRAVFSKNLKGIKYLLLLLVCLAALLGISMAAYAAPVSIATRFFGLFVYPALTVVADAMIALIRPLADKLGLYSLDYANLANSHFLHQWFIVALPLGIFAFAALAPRFWCRYLCPAGAILAIMSFKPLIIRRRVNEDCTSCGLCQERCPMDAIMEDPHGTKFSECILCNRCSKVCPAHAVGFISMQTTQSPSDFSKCRRYLVILALSGFGTVVAYRLGIRLGASAMNRQLIRPPGAITEASFSGRCIGCGECMKVCPTNTLQPSGMAAGLAGFFSPMVVPRQGPCNNKCNACGYVCPTQAIRPLELDEKMHAKIGTAAIDRKRCIAWEDSKPCLVCAEVCPYGAIDIKEIIGKEASVPVVQAGKCIGCGFCEYHCPVETKAAIVVESNGSIRLDKGSYIQKSAQMGLSIEPRKQGASEPGTAPMKAEGSLPPGFTE